LRRRKATAAEIEQASLLEGRVTTAVCAPAIRKAITEWRGQKYRGPTDMSRLLLNHWFGTDHRLPGGRHFRYYDAQREAVETLIYLYEVAKVRRHRDVVEKFATVPGLHVLQYDEFTRYSVNMATGSGKTKVMALAVARHFSKPWRSGATTTPAPS
jgi:type III restriction enzyme